MEKVEIEFRYSDKKKSWDDSSPINKFFMVGLYETIEEAVNAGNDALNILKKRGFELRANDRFKVNGLFGSPDRLISNTCYTNGKATFFAKITNVSSGDLNSVIDETIEAKQRYCEFKKTQSEDD